MSAVVAPAIHSSSHSRTGPWRRPYLAVALIVAIMAFIGFWRTYYGRVASGDFQFIALIHLHGAVGVAWLVAFIAQTSLAATGRISLHVRLGPWIMGLGALFVLVGMILGLYQFGERIADGHFDIGSRRLIGSIREPLFIAPFMVVAWVRRREPELHKRLMIVIATLILLPAISRMQFLGRPVPEWKMMLVWPIPVYLAMLHDFVTKRRVHTVYVVGLLAMLAMRLALPFRETEAWLAFTRWLAGFY